MLTYFFTDFGISGPYVGQMKSVIFAGSSDNTIIDLMHDAPKYNPRASAYLLSALMRYLPEEAIIVAVVDPGVGDPARKPVMIKSNKRWFIGPDNGLLCKVIDFSTSVTCYEIIPDTGISKSFHGRDVFAPVAKELSNGKMPDCILTNKENLIGYDWPDNIEEIIYIDHYGNAITGVQAESLNKTSIIMIGEIELHYAATFSDVSEGEMFWYENSIGLIEFSKNYGSFSEETGCAIGGAFKIT